MNDLIKYTIAALAGTMLSAGIDATHTKPTSFSREEVISVSAATPAAAQAGSDAPAPNASTTPAISATTATSEEAALAVVSLPEIGGDQNIGNSHVSTEITEKTVATAPVTHSPPAYQGRYVLVNQPIYGRFGRFQGYQQVYRWQQAYSRPAQYYVPQRRVYYYGNCANGMCR